MLLVSSIKGFKPQTNKISCFIGFFPHYRKQRFLLILSNKALSGYRSLPAKLSASYLHAFVSVQHVVSLPPSEAFRKLFPRFVSVQHAVSLPLSEAPQGSYGVQRRSVFITRAGRCYLEIHALIGMPMIS